MDYRKNAIRFLKNFDKRKYRDCANYRNGSLANHIIMIERGRHKVEYVFAKSDKKSSKNFLIMWSKKNGFDQVDVEKIHQAAKKFPKIRKGFYSGWEWKKLRYRVLQEYGPVCMCCGASSRDDDVRIVVDHIKPVSIYPELALDYDNLQVLCNDCNMGKSNTDYTDYRPVKEYPECDVSLSVVMGERMH